MIQLETLSDKFRMQEHGLWRKDYKISFKKEGLPSSECFNCFGRHLGIFFGTQ